MLERQMIYPDLRRLRDAPFRFAQRRLGAAAVQGAPQIAGKYHRGAVGMALLAFEFTKELDAGPVAMLPVLSKRELVLRAGLLTVSPSQAVSSRRILVKSASISSTAGCSGWRSNNVILSSSRVRPPQRPRTAAKQVASAIVGVTPFSPARWLKAFQRVVGTIMRRRVLRTSRSVAGSQASGKTGAGGSIDAFASQ